MNLLLAAVLLAHPAQANSKVVVIPAAQAVQRLSTLPENRPGLQGIELAKAPGYTVFTIRRTKPDLAEAHARLTDIWYVIAGSGTLVTGGALTDQTETERGELRGRGITGGESRSIAKGDVVTIPAGIPHWVAKIDGEVIYLIVKVASQP